MNVGKMSYKKFKLQEAEPVEDKATLDEDADSEEETADESKESTE